MKTRSSVGTLQSRARTRPARPVQADCDTWTIYSCGLNGCVKRDLDGRLFFVERKKLGGRDCSYRDLKRREIGFREALDFITKYSWWKRPWKVLAHHGIKRPSAA